MASYVAAIGQYPRAGCLAGQVLPWLTFKPGPVSRYLLDTFPWVNAVLRLEQDQPVTRNGDRFPHGPNMAFRADLLRQRPFDGDSQFAIMSAHLEKDPVPPVSIDPSLPEALNDLILMAVAKDPAQRFQSAGAFRNALGSFAVAAPAAGTCPTPRRARRG